MEVEKKYRKPNITILKLILVNKTRDKDDQYSCTSKSLSDYLTDFPPGENGAQGHFIVRSHAQIEKCLVPSEFCYWGASGANT